MSLNVSYLGGSLEVVTVVKFLTVAAPAKFKKLSQLRVSKPPEPAASPGGKWG